MGVAKEATVEAVILIVGALAGIVLGFLVGTQYQRKQSATVLGSGMAETLSVTLSIPKKSA